jgi:ribosomal-protein-serine acetyltransferase
MCIETELRKISVNDAEELFLLIDKNRDYLSRWLAWVTATRSIGDSINFLNNLVDSDKQGNTCSFVIALDGAIIGSIGLRSIDIEQSEALVGYWLDERLLGRRIMTRSCSEVVDLAHRKLNISKVILRCAPHNLASQKVAVNCDFKYSCIIKDAEQINNHYNDLLVYVHER